MTNELKESSDFPDDPVMDFIQTGQARTLREAEKMYLDASQPEILALLASSASNDELADHPLMVLLRQYGTRGWEDSVL